MVEFLRGDLDVLVATTIIESGLDIPQVNTLIIERADVLGLAQLYQIRGRVGRGENAAHAYLMYPDGSELSEEARARLAALADYTELGLGLPRRAARPRAARRRQPARRRAVGPRRRRRLRALLRPAGRGRRRAERQPRRPHAPRAPRSRAGRLRAGRLRRLRGRQARRPPPHRAVRDRRRAARHRDRARPTASASRRSRSRTSSSPRRRASSWRCSAPTRSRCAGRARRSRASRSGPADLRELRERHGRVLYNAAAAEIGLPLAPERPLAQVIALVDTLGDLVNRGGATG